MNRSITAEVRPIIQELEAYFNQATVLQFLKERGVPLFDQISASRPYAVTDIPLTALPKETPEIMGCIRIAVFFPNIQTKIERHPNSQQFLWSFEGQGITKVFRNDIWAEDSYGEGIENTLEASTWHFVAKNTWHQSIGTGTAPWVLVAIHTANEVMDEYWEQGNAL